MPTLKMHALGTPNSFAGFMADAAVTDIPTISYAGFWRRLAALALDLIVVLILSKAVLLVWLNFGFDPDIMDIYLLDANFPFYCTLHQLPIIRDWEVGYACIASYLAVSCIYFVLFTSSALHATPGKKLLRMAVVTPTGERVVVGRALLRYLCSWLSIMPLFFGFFLAFLTPGRRTLHDYFAGTVVINTPQKTAR